ncbi:hypothetical protein [Cohnella faecalis]
MYVLTQSEGGRHKPSSRLPSAVLLQQRLEHQ